MRLYSLIGGRSLLKLPRLGKRHLLSDYHLVIRVVRVTGVYGR